VISEIWILHFVRDDAHGVHHSGTQRFPCPNGGAVFFPAEVACCQRMLLHPA
jgi:hypothetical protein